MPVPFPFPSLADISGHPDQILKAVEKAFGQNKRLAHQAGMYLCHQCSGKKGREIGELFGVGPSAITEASRHFSKRMDRDERLAEEVNVVREALNI